MIESDRVEGTAVYDPQGTQVGTIKRLLIEKVSGRVLYVDVTFGGFLGLGVHHHTVPWDKLSYDTELEGYRTDVTEDQVQGAPAFYGDDRVWPDRSASRRCGITGTTFPAVRSDKVSRSGFVADMMRRLSGPVGGRHEGASVQGRPERAAESSTAHHLPRAVFTVLRLLPSTAGGCRSTASRARPS